MLGQPHEAIVADLSHGGLKLEAAKQLRAGDVIEVTMDLSATLITFPGRSLSWAVSSWLTPPPQRGAGSTDAHVCFLDGQHKAVEAVDRFVAQQLKCRGG